MKTKILILPATVLCFTLAAFYFGCTKNSPTAGSGSETQNALVSGMLYKASGPAAGAKVFFVKVNYNPRSGALEKAHVISDTVTTDSSGAYGTNDLDTGTYNVFGVGTDGSLSLVDSVHVTGDTQAIPPDTLKLPGSLAGIIKMQGTDDPRTVFVIPLGTNGFASTSITGGFSLSNMAEGPYSVRFLSILDRYLPLDTTFTVTAGTNLTLPDSIKLPLKIPTPTGFQIAYDTLKQIVTLSWDKGDSSRVKGYNVYRQHLDSAEVKLNAQPILNALYVDSTGIQDQTYAYTVAGVDFENKEGIRTPGDSVTMMSGYVVVDSLQKGLLAEKDGIAFIARYATGNKIIVQSYDNQLQVLTTVQLDSILDQPQSFDLDSVGNLIFAANNGVYKFSPTGALLDTIDTWSNRENKTLIVYDTTIFLASGVIRKYSLVGDTLGSLNEMPSFRADGLIVHQGQIFAGGNRNEIRAYGLNLIFVESWTLNFLHNETVWSLGKDEFGNIYILGYHSNPDFYTMLIYSSTRQYVGKIDIGVNTKNFLVLNGKIILSTGNNLLVLKRR